MTLYVVIDREGEVRRRGTRATRTRGLMVYARLCDAKRYANKPGDAVVAVDVDMTRQPLWIKEAKL